MTVSKLPNSWQQTTLGEICTSPQYGFTTSATRTDTGIKFLRITDLNSGGVTWSNVPYCAQLPDNVDKFILRDGDIVIARSGSVGKAYLVTKPEYAVFASYLIRFRSIELEAKYVAFYLQSSDYWQQIGDASTGNTIYNVNAQKMSRITIPLAPLNEQRRIVEAIEEQFSRIDAGIAALKRLQANLKRYKAAVLKAACEGKLVPQNPHDEPASELLARILQERRAKWEAEQRARGKDPNRLTYPEPAAPDTDDLHELPEGWVWANVAQLLYEDMINGRSVQTGINGFPVLRLTAIKSRKIDLTEYKLGSWTAEEAKPFLAQVNDFLVSRGNGSRSLVGRGGLVDKLTMPVAFPDTMIRLRFNHQHVYAHYVSFIWDSPMMRKQIEKSARTTAGIYKINQDLISSYIFPLPPFLEQVRISEAVDMLLVACDDLSNDVLTSLQRAERLRQSILHRAFSGQLVPQDPHDEPASDLLARIQAKRKAQQPPKKARHAHK